MKILFMYFHALLLLSYRTFLETMDCSIQLQGSRCEHWPSASHLPFFHVSLLILYNLLSNLLRFTEKSVSEHWTSQCLDCNLHHAAPAFEWCLSPRPWRPSNLYERSAGDASSLCQEFQTPFSHGLYRPRNKTLWTKKAHQISQWSLSRTNCPNNCYLANHHASSVHWMSDKTHRMLDRCCGNIPDTSRTLCCATGEVQSQCYPPTPEIRAKVKREKPIIKDIRLLDVRSEEMLQDCFDYTDW